MDEQGDVNGELDNDNTAGNNRPNDSVPVNDPDQILNFSSLLYASLLSQAQNANVSQNRNANERETNAPLESSPSISNMLSEYVRQRTRNSAENHAAGRGPVQVGDGQLDSSTVDQIETSDLAASGNSNVTSTTGPTETVENTNDTSTRNDERRIAQGEAVIAWIERHVLVYVLIFAAIFFFENLADIGLLIWMNLLRQRTNGIVVLQLKKARRAARSSFRRRGRSIPMLITVAGGLFLNSLVIIMAERFYLLDFKFVEIIPITVSIFVDFVNGVFEKTYFEWKGDGDFTLMRALWLTFAFDLIVRHFAIQVKAILVCVSESKERPSLWAQIRSLFGRNDYSPISTEVQNEVEETNADETVVNITETPRRPRSASRHRYSTDGFIFFVVEITQTLVRLAVPIPIWIMYLSIPSTTFLRRVPYIIGLGLYLMVKVFKLYGALAQTLYAWRTLIRGHQLYGKPATPLQLSECDADCPVCQEPFHIPIALTGCGHIFCDDCILQWLDRQTTCPMCRATIPTVLCSSHSDDDALLTM